LDFALYARRFPAACSELGEIGRSNRIWHLGGVPVEGVASSYAAIVAVIHPSPSIGPKTG
jgi:hypothetical protein